MNSERRRSRVIGVRRVVRDRGQHAFALPHVGLQPCLHAIEGGGSTAHLGRPPLRERRAVHVTPELVGRAGEDRQRAREPAHGKKGEADGREEQNREGE